VPGRGHPLKNFGISKFHSTATEPAPSLSFAEVLRKNLPAASPARRQPPPPHGRKVRFASALSNVEFWAGSPPSSVAHRSSVVRPTQKGIWPRSIARWIRREFSSDHGQHVSSSVSLQSSQSLPCPSPHLFNSSPRAAQDMSSDQPWQVVRKKGWWRSERKAAKSKDALPCTRGRHIFKARVAGRCYNCLASDHHVML
jgi:hypothetical protein